MENKMGWLQYLPSFITIALTSGGIVAGFILWVYQAVIIPQLRDQIDNPQKLLDYYDKKSDHAYKAFEELDKELKKEVINRKKLQEQINTLKGALTTGLINLGLFTNPEIQKALDNRYFKVMLLNGVRLVKPFRSGDIYLGEDILDANAIILDFTNQKIVSNELDETIYNYFKSYKGPINVVYSQKTLQNHNFPKLIDNQWGKGGFSTINTAVESFDYNVQPYDKKFFSDVVKRMNIQKDEEPKEYWREISF